MKKTNEEAKPVMSENMKASIRKVISKFGFTDTEYEKFLERVGAMREGSVLKYSNEEIEAYRERFVKKHEYSIGDNFMFDRFSKIKTSDENGHTYDTGLFCPRSFWDGVLKMR